MGDPFRNELETVLQRSAELEAENARLRASLEAPERAPRPATPPRRGVARFAVAAASIFVATAIAGFLLLSRAAPPQQPGFNGVAIAAPVEQQAGPAPRCATQDCATGKIIDNGCTPDGRCASCVNFCPPPTPTASGRAKCACTAGDPLCTCLP